MNKRGIMVIIAAVAIQMTLGISYIWSVFQTGIAESIFGGDNARAGLAFSLLLAMLGIGGVIGGKLAARIGYRWVVLIGGCVTALGFFLSGFVTASVPWMLWLTYGVMGGLGMGLAYSTTIALAQKWFPTRKGLVTGIIVSALGFGGVVFAPIVEALIKAFGGAGSGESATFMILAAVFVVVSCVGSLFLAQPKSQVISDKSQGISKVEVESKTTKQVLSSPQFYLITFTLLLGCMGGLMIIAFAKPIAVGKGLGDAAVVGVLIISIFNSLGRVVWGFVSDKLGRCNTVIVLLLGTALLAPVVIVANGFWIFVFIAMIGFFYGGILGTFPSLTADNFGPKNQATNYGFVLIGFGAGAILSSLIAGHYRNISVNNINLMIPAFLIASACALIGAGLIVLLKILNKRTQDKATHK